MVLIISKAFDPSTCKVIDWLYYLNESFFKINGSEILSNDLSMHIGLGNTDSMGYEGMKNGDLLETVHSIWFRRDENYLLPNDYLQETIDREYHAELLKYLNVEHLAGKQAFFSCIIQDKKILGHFLRNKNQKIDTLLIARRSGLDIPATLITNSKSVLLDFVRRHPAVITKAIGNGFSFVDQNAIYLNYTEDLPAETIDRLPDKFFYSLFQERLEKEFDVRVFYLDGICYSMAIFPGYQKHIDVRRYRHNRSVPFRLPKTVDDKIRALMNTLQLNTGSIDMIKTRDGRLVFLEVNPVGQYDPISIHCNYQLDKKIAEYLIQK